MEAKKTATLVWKAICLSLLFLLVQSSTASADIVISYGTNVGGTPIIGLLPNTPNQSVQLFASGVAGEGGADALELNLQIGDGGATFNGSDTRPVFQGLDLITGTIWENNGTVQTDISSDPLARLSTVETDSVIMIDGLIGTVVFDTTGFFSGTIDFRTSGVGGAFDTVFFRSGQEVETEAPNGLIRIITVPEPSASILVTMFFGTMIRRRKRFAL